MHLRMAPFLKGSNNGIPLLLLTAAPHSNPISKNKSRTVLYKSAFTFLRISPYLYALTTLFTRQMKFPYTSSSANICSSKTPCSSNPLFFICKFHLTPKYINLLRITRHRQKCIYKRLRYIMTAIRLIKLVRYFSFLFYLWNVFRKNCFPFAFFAPFRYSRLYNPHFHMRTFSYGHPCGQLQI